MRIKRILLSMTCIALFVGQYTFADIDLAIQSISMANNDTTIGQFSTPVITVVATNL